jgi:hypothetical protein
METIHGDCDGLRAKEGHQAISEGGLARAGSAADSDQETTIGTPLRADPLCEDGKACVHVDDLA